MLSRTKITLVTFIAIFAFSFYASCKKKEKSSETSEDQTGSLQVAVTEEVKSSLTAPVASGGGGLTATQAEPIVAGALAVNASQASLYLAEEKKVETPPIGLAATAVAKGAIGALDETAAELGADTDKIKIAKVISGAVVTALKTRMDGIDPEARKLLPGLVAGASIGALDDGGIGKDAMALAVGQIASGAVSVLDDAGFASGDDFAEVMKNFMELSVGSFDDLGLADGNAYAGIMDDFMAGAIGSMDEVGLEGGAETYKGFMDDMVKGAFSGLGDMGLAKDDMFGMFDEIMEGAVGALNNLDGVDPADIGGMVSFMGQEAIGFMDDLDYMDSANMDDVCGFIAEGTMTAMGEFVEDGWMNMAVMEDGLQDFTKSSMGAMYDQFNGGNWEMEGDFGDFGAVFTEGMSNGLNEAGWETDDINSMSDEMQEGFNDGLEGEDGYDSTWWDDSMADAAAVSPAEAAAWCSEDGGTFIDGECTFAMTCEENTDDVSCITPCVWDGAMCYSEDMAVAPDTAPDTNPAPSGDCAGDCTMCDSESTCNGNVALGCSWDSPADPAGMCSGGGGSCGTYGMDDSACDADPNCYWAGATCEDNI